MFPRTGPQDEWSNEHILTSVPRGARRILIVGCGEGRLGTTLKEQQSERLVEGVEPNPSAAEIARRRLDRVDDRDVHTALGTIDPGTFDCVIVGDILQHLPYSGAMLAAVHAALVSDGVIVVSLPNVGHYSIIGDLLRAEFTGEPGSHFTFATITKMLLDAGFLPGLEAAVSEPIADEDMRAARPLLERVGVNPGSARKHLDASRYVFKGTKLTAPATGFSSTRITFVACVNDASQLRANLLRSPCLAPGTPHELLMMRDSPNAAEGFNRGIDSATHDLIVFVQQDMYLPRGWDTVFTKGFEEAEAGFSPLGVVGAFGLRYRDGEIVHVGRVVDRDKLLDMSVPLPAEVDGIDEILLAVRRSTPLRFDPALGFHLYGADICLSARARGLRIAIIEAPCFHNSLFATLSPAFHRAREVLLAKWPYVRPLYTNMGRLETMQEKPPSPSWLGQQTEKVVALSRERDALRRDLTRAETRIRKMEASQIWKARIMVGKVARRIGIKRPGRSRGPNAAP